MGHFRSIVLLFAANVVIISSLLIFMTGYFRSTTRSSSAALDDGEQYGGYTTGEPPFDKVIFMLVDALRSDFVYGEQSGFEFTQSLIQSGAAIPLTALAALPTLTVSRLKALTQGTAQSFLDAWVNVANSPDVIRLEGEDTWLSRLKSSRGYEKKLVFYGVDMWLDLYPDIFDRYEGFFGFYMPDITTLDANISAQVPNELRKDDWVSLVMHYENLDSLAHQGGLRSTHMRPKQTEMDNVVRMIYDGILHQPHLRNTLLVLLGDHGMDEQGNHGGDTPGELASAMVLVSPNFKGKSRNYQVPMKPREDYKFYSVINQVDIVPTLAGLLDFDIPAANIGVFIPDVLDVFTSTKQRLDVLMRNARQMMRLANLTLTTNPDSPLIHTQGCEEYEAELEKLHCLWVRVTIAEKKWKDTNSLKPEAFRSAIDDVGHQERLSIVL
ncbi:alkaline-phosphatase-like protein [Xylaria palmicola]|nr:alkaline-phosphatase-like protein [Xylaria palmicola]